MFIYLSKQPDFIKDAGYGLTLHTEINAIKKESGVAHKDAQTGHFILKYPKGSAEREEIIDAYLTEVSNYVRSQILLEIDKFKTAGIQLPSYFTKVANPSSTNLGR